MRVKTWHCLSLLALAGLLVYYPSLHAGYNSVDDLNMISSVDQSGPLDLGRLFLPQGTSYYYRPLTVLTYVLDRDAWGSTPSFMHLGNILLHLTCAMLVYAITRRLLPLWKVESQAPALFAGLFFVLHPLTTESVCWISGRTDPLMTVFVLVSVWLTLKALERAGWVAALGAGAALCLAGLAKEVAVFALPGLLWLIVIYPGKGSWITRLRSRFWIFSMTLIGTVGYFLLRHLAISHDSGVSIAVQGLAEGDYDLLNKLRLAFKVYGFYFKKLLVPWPLNFGIVEASEWYVLSGILLSLLLLYLFWRADVPGAFGLLAFCALSPALLVVYGKMTWAPLAERYLYTSVALFAPLAAFLLVRLRAFSSPVAWNPGRLAMLFLLTVFFGTTLHRAWVWQDNLRLYADTVAKSPDLLSAKSELAVALMQRGKLDEAEKILKEIQREETSQGYINDDLNMAEIMASRGELRTARDQLLPLLKTNHKRHYDILQAVLRINQKLIGQMENPEDKLALQIESLAWLQEQQRLRPKAFTLYRIGKMQLAMGDETAALASFQNSLAKTPANAHYRGALKTFIIKLEGS